VSEPRGDGLYLKLVQSILAAGIGAAIGYGYARINLPAEVQTRAAHLIGVYASAGAVIGVVGLRFGLLVRAMIRDYLRRDR